MFEAFAVHQIKPPSQVSNSLRTTLFCFRHAQDREINSASHRDPWAASHLRHTFADAYKERVFVDAHPWRTPVLGANVPYHPSGCIQCSQFDSTGELLATGGVDGTVLVHSSPAILNAAATAAAGEGATIKVEPLLAIQTNLSKLHSVRWNPLDENVVGVASASSRSVHIYDLQRTQGRPTRILTLPSQTAGGVGAGDMAFFGSNTRGSGSSSSGTGISGGVGLGYSVLVGGPNGNAFLWDLRCSGGPASTLQSLQGGAVTSCHLMDSDQVVIVGTLAGDVKAWDLRGGRGGALRFGGVPHHHPMLTCVNLRIALTEITALLEQSGGIPLCTVQSMAPDPLNPRRVGFHLGCGWSGVLDLPTRKITHVHAPPQTLVAEQPTPEDGARAMVLWAQMAAPTLRRRACWSEDGTRFVVPSRQQDAISLLDFAESTHAGCCSEVPDEGLVGEGGSAMPRVPPSATTVKISQAAICAAAMPSSHMLVACGAHNFMSVLVLS